MKKKVRATGTQKMKNITLLLTLTLLASACSDPVPPPRPVPSAPPPSGISTHIEAKEFLMNSESFDLAQLMAKLQEGKLNDAAAIEAYINDPAMAINNVDLDSSGDIDPLTVKEQAGENGRIVMAINAHPKGQKEPVTVAEISFTKSASGDVQVEGAYPEYVHTPLGRSYYSYHRPISAGDVFLAWMFMPHRSPYYHPWGGGHYMGMGYMGVRPVMGHSAMMSSRTTRTTTTKTTVSPQKKPASYKPRSAGAKKTVAKQGARRAKAQAGSSVKSMKGAGKSFSARDKGKAKGKANNFKPNKAAAASKRPAAKARRPSRPSRPSRPARRSSGGRRRR